MNRTENARALLLSVLLALACIGIASAQLQSFEVLSRNCSAVSPAQEKIRRCEQLISANKLDGELKLSPFLEIASAYLDLNRIDKAIEYAKRYVERTDSYYRLNAASVRCKGMNGEVLRICVASSSTVTSAAHQWVGRYEALSALELSIARRFEESAAVAKSAIGHISRAIRVNPDNYPAYAERAGLFARFCKKSETESDYSMAIRLALRQGRDEQAREYREKLAFSAGECQPEYRDRF
jgi:tetratricopeptide (TPR) repeat protein